MKMMMLVRFSNILKIAAFLLLTASLLTCVSDSRDIEEKQQGQAERSLGDILEEQGYFKLKSNCLSKYKKYNSLYNLISDLRTLVRNKSFKSSKELIDSYKTVLDDLKKMLNRKFKDGIKISNDILDSLQNLEGEPKIAGVREKLKMSNSIIFWRINTAIESKNMAPDSVAFRTCSYNGDSLLILPRIYRNYSDPYIIVDNDTSIKSLQNLFIEKERFENAQEVSILIAWRGMAYTKYQIKGE